MLRFVQDLGYAVRTLARRPALVVVAALSLGLGAGANATVFSLLNTLLLQPPTATAPERLLRIEPGNSNLVSVPNFRDLLPHSVISAYAAYGTMRLDLGRAPETRSVVGMMLSSNLFDVVGARTAQGRAFDAQAHAPQQNARVVIVSDRLWRARSDGFEGLGSAIFLNGQPFTVIGVLAPNFRPLTGALRPDVYVPISSALAPDIGERRAPMLTLIARITPGATLDQVASAFAAESRRLEAAFPDVNKQFGNRPLVVPVSGLASLQGRSAPQGLYVIVAAPFVLVGLVLLIACANVAALLLAHGLSRRREIGIRLALGAGRRDLVRMLLTESLLLSVAGALIGLMLTVWVMSAIAGIRLPNVPDAMELGLTFDTSLWVYLAGLILATTLICSLFPARQALRQVVIDALNTDSAGQRIHGRLSLRRALVVVQVSVAALLVFLSVVCLQSLRSVIEVAPGFDVDAGIVARLDLDPVRYTPSQVRLTAERLSERIAQVPGITAVSYANIVPLGGDSSIAFPIGDARPGANGPETNVTNVGPDYFKTMGIPFVRGREFIPADRDGAPLVAIANEALAQALFGSGNPIGRRVRRHADAPDYEIVGIVRNSKYQFLSEAPRPLLYVPYLQSGGRLMLHARAVGQPALLVAAVRAAITGTDAALMPDVRTLRDVTSQEFTMRRAGTALLGALGIVGLLLSIVGLYGLVAHTVSQRTSEFGIRIALGAQSGSILWAVIGDSVRLTVVGIVIGLGIAFAVIRPLGFLFADASPTDFATLVPVALTFIMVSLVASFEPAWRAVRIDPLVALRRD